jgi:hypothetical protein
MAAQPAAPVDVPGDAADRGALVAQPETPATPRPDWRFDVIIQGRSLSHGVLLDTLHPCLVVCCLPAERELHRISRVLGLAADFLPRQD